MIKDVLKNIWLVNAVYQALIGKRKTEKVLAVRQQLLQEKGAFIVAEVEKALSNSETRHFLAYGSLLGMVRDGKFMEYDDDLDFGIFFDNGYDWSKLEQDLHACGFKKGWEFVRDGKVEEQTYMKDGLPVDFFLFYDEGEQSKSRSFIRLKCHKYKSPDEYSMAVNAFRKIMATKELEISGLTFSAPVDPEAFLEDAYTATWNIPDSKWSDRSNPNYMILNDVHAIERRV